MRTSTTILPDMRRRGREGAIRCPRPAEFATTLGRWGIKPGTLVVAYDNMGCAIAGRLWWMMNWMGHERAGLLDGGIQAWEAADLPLERAEPIIEPADYPVGGHCRPVVGLTEVERAALNGDMRMLDARDSARYQGLSEPLDSQAGTRARGAQRLLSARTWTPAGGFGRPTNCASITWIFWVAPTPPGPASCAVPESRPAMTCSPWSWRVLEAPRCIPVPGANGRNPTPVP